MREPSPGAVSPKGSTASLNVTRNAGFQQQNGAEHLPWSNPAMALSGNCSSNLTNESSGLVRTVSNASALTSLSADLSPSDSHFFEVLYIGKVRISQRKVPETLIDDALNKFTQHEAEKIKNSRRHSLLSSSRASQDSTDSDIKNSPEHAIEQFRRNNLVPSTTPLEPDKNIAWKSAENLQKLENNEVDKEFDDFTKERVDKNNKQPVPLEPKVLVINVPKNNLGTVTENEERHDDITENSQINPIVNSTDLKGTTNVNNTNPFKESEINKGTDVDPLLHVPVEVRSNIKLAEIKVTETKIENENNKFGEINGKPNNINEEKKNLLPDNKPYLRDRSASIGTLNLKTPLAHLIGEQNRTMLFQVGRSELRLISPDRKQILLHRAFKDVASCVLGRINKEHFGFVCREANDYACYVFKCESDSVATEVVNAIKQAFVAHADLLKKSRDKSPNMTCEHCPMLWYHRLCHDIEGMNEKKIHAFILRRIEQLADDEQELIITKYQGGTNHMYEVSEHNAFLMMLLRAHCEAKQQRHVHDTAENRSEFLNQYLGGSTIFMKAKRSLSSGFDHLLKRRQSKDDVHKKELSPIPTPNALETSSEPNNSDLLTSTDTRCKSLSPGNLIDQPSSPKSNTVSFDEGTEENKEETSVNSPMMDIFLKVSDSRAAANESGNESDATWRQAIYEKVVQPGKDEGDLQQTDLLGHPVSLPGKRSKEQLRQLWKMAIDQTILLVRMEKENARLKEREESSAVRRIKLEYAELGTCDTGASCMWDSLLARDPSQPIAKVDRHMLKQAVRQGVPRMLRGGVWYFLAEQAALAGAPPDARHFPLYHTPYRALLAGLTKHQHAILIDLGEWPLDRRRVYFLAEQAALAGAPPDARHFPLYHTPYRALLAGLTKHQHAILIDLGEWPLDRRRVYFLAEQAALAGAPPDARHFPLYHTPYRALLAGLTKHQHAILIDLGEWPLDRRRVYFLAEQAALAGAPPDARHFPLYHTPYRALLAGLTKHQHAILIDLGEYPLDRRRVYFLAEQAALAGAPSDARHFPLYHTPYRALLAGLTKHQHAILIDLGEWPLDRRRVYFLAEQAALAGAPPDARHFPLYHTPYRALLAGLTKHQHAILIDLGEWPLDRRRVYFLAEQAALAGAPPDARHFPLYHTPYRALLAGLTKHQHAILIDLGEYPLDRRRVYFLAEQAALAGAPSDARHFPLYHTPYRALLAGLTKHQHAILIDLGEWPLDRRRVYFLAEQAALAGAPPDARHFPLYHTPYRALLAGLTKHQHAILIDLGEWPLDRRRVYFLAEQAALAGAPPDARHFPLYHTPYRALLAGLTKHQHAILIDLGEWPLDRRRVYFLAEQAALAGAPPDARHFPLYHTPYRALLAGLTKHQHAILIDLGEWPLDRRRVYFLAEQAALAGAPPDARHFPLYHTPYRALLAGLTKHQHAILIDLGEWPLDRRRVYFLAEQAALAGAPSDARHFPLYHTPYRALLAGLTKHQHAILIDLGEWPLDRRRVYFLAEQAALAGAPPDARHFPLYHTPYRALLAGLTKHQHAILIDLGEWPLDRRRVYFLAEQAALAGAPPDARHFPLYHTPYRALLAGLTKHQHAILIDLGEWPLDRRRVYFLAEQAALAGAPPDARHFPLYHTPYRALLAGLTKHQHAILIDLGEWPLDRRRVYFLAEQAALAGAPPDARHFPLYHTPYRALLAGLTKHQHAILIDLGEWPLDRRRVYFLAEQAALAGAPPDARHFPLYHTPYRALLAGLTKHQHAILIDLGEWPLDRRRVYFLAEQAALAGAPPDARHFPLYHTPYRALLAGLTKHQHAILIDLGEWPLDRRRVYFLAEQAALAGAPPDARHFPLYHTPYRALLAGLTKHQHAILIDLGEWPLDRRRVYFLAEQAALAGAPSDARHFPLYHTPYRALLAGLTKHQHAILIDLGEWPLDIQTRLSESQFEFRARRSTIDALKRLRAVTGEAEHGREVVVAVSLDIANAFNSLPHAVIREALKYFGVPPYLRRLLEAYLSDRRVGLENRSGSVEWWRVGCGVPQGSVLGPILWASATRMTPSFIPGDDTTRRRRGWPRSDSTS
ncbi:unnamed protein product [Euphydryas editha]|uniref:PID domain-containing protein n=1 Tax=Euphydryas editha TaxID=104508 RepID=A0AAU9URG5_EUPED|nr:unnamed protein product [Euphydryas editha]